MDAKLQAAYDEYMRLERNEAFRVELQRLQGDSAELRRRLLSRMEFGTAGLRARMGAGFSCMNDLTLVQTTQGLLRYLQSERPDLAAGGHCIVVGYDGRHNSLRWAKLIANIFSRAGVRVQLYSAVTPTPFVPFGVLHFKAAAGVMVTASHNPKEDNGYKVYWDNGAQIIAPRDAGISAAIADNLQPWPGSFDFEELVHDSQLVCDPLAEVSELYYAAQVREVCYTPQANAASKLQIVYSAMHGVGARYVVEILSRFKFPPKFIAPVPEQRDPDPDFPTVTFPNPEEGRSALDLSCRLAEKLGCPVILANDPDADRLAIAEAAAGGGWRIFTGNETAALLGWWLLRNFTQRWPEVGAEDRYFLYSTVSSRILASIAERDGCQVRETLTGFKYMGNVAHTLLTADKKRVVFAFEEAIGFMCGERVLDKDGVSAAGVAAELASFAYASGKTLAGQLSEIYDRYGHHVSNNGYFFSRDPDATRRMFQQLREPAYPDGVDVCIDGATTRVSVESVRDVTRGFDSAADDKKCKFPAGGGSEMLTFRFRLPAPPAVATLTLRTSGTEPKIKWYSEVIGDSPERLRAQLDALVVGVQQSFVRPKEFGFELMNSAS